MQLLHRTVRTARRLIERARRWRDEIAAYPIDHDRWLR